ncbi:MAG TPA: metallophosphoesterase family protein [Chthoniobacterales bacterium]|jgi:predicted phosphodiesterase|nr:metallophosphoesterase family protein [Chthoniobacterales bacterium]
MRIAVLADIHANLLALEAVIADLEVVRPDQVIVAGDFQNRGPAPKEVYDRLRKMDWPLLRGNHEDYVIEQSESPAEEAHAVDLYAWQPARWTAERVPETIPFLRTLPIAIQLSGPDGSFVCIAHGSPRSNAEGFFPSTGDAKAFAMLGQPLPKVLCCGHTHIPLQRQIGPTRVFNVGSVGFPFDGDVRAAYGILDWKEGEWSTELRRVPYAVEAVVEDLRSPQFHEGFGPLVKIIQRELETARPHLTLFTLTFLPRVRSGEFTIGEAINVYLGYSQAEIENLYLELRKRLA